MLLVALGRLLFAVHVETRNVWLLAWLLLLFLLGRTLLASFLNLPRIKPARFTSTAFFRRGSLLFRSSLFGSIRSAKSRRRSVLLVRAWTAVRNRLVFALLFLAFCFLPLTEGFLGPLNRIAFARSLAIDVRSAAILLRGPVSIPVTWTITISVHRSLAIPLTWPLNVAVPLARSVGLDPGDSWELQTTHSTFRLFPLASFRELGQTRLKPAAFLSTFTNRLGKLFETLSALGFQASETDRAIVILRELLDAASQPKSAYLTVIATFEPTTLIYQSIWRTMVFMLDIVVVPIAQSVRKVDILTGVIPVVICQQRVICTAPGRVFVPG